MKTKNKSLKVSVSIYRKYRMASNAYYLVDTDDSRFDKTFCSLDDAIDYCEELLVCYPDVFIDSIRKIECTRYLLGFHYSDKF